MNAQTIQNEITKAIIAKSGLEQHRDYVGFSKIGNCPLQIYREFMSKQKTTTTESDHRFCYAGYHQEDDIAGILESAGILAPGTRNTQIVSSISPIFKGHIDGLTIGGELIEIKSVNGERFERIRSKQKCDYRHFIQVQLYMRYGGMPCAFVIYRNRDTYETLVLRVPYVKGVADDLEKKALEILDAIKNETAPACTCGHCVITAPTTGVL